MYIEQQCAEQQQGARLVQRTQYHRHLHQQGRYAERELQDNHHTYQFKTALRVWLAESGASAEVPDQQQHSSDNG